MTVGKKAGEQYMILDISLNTTVLMLDFGSERLENAKILNILLLNVFACKIQSLV